ncbi:hypothetical protein [Stenotrophomonas maltophilia]|nr:hypothetical protein [Stenotrophomonas maltophilia]
MGVDLGRHDELGNNQWGQMAGSTLDASVDNGEDGGWFFRLAPHGATHP